MTDKHTALSLLKQQGLTLCEAARLILELLEESGGNKVLDKLAHCRRVIRLGSEVLRKEESTVSFARAVDETLVVKHQQQRSKRTISDIRYYMRRLMRESPELPQRPLRAISTQECSALLERVYPTPSQRRKARAILSGVFRTGQRHGWCGENPVRQVEVPVVRESEIIPLSLPELKRLLSTAQQKRHASCLPALALMLYAGVRPEEVTRLEWNHIDDDEHEINIPPRHSKTGGGRRIAICPALQQILSRWRQNASTTPLTRICPPNWKARWKRLRIRAGFHHWVPDVLRHTFASYYVKQYRDMNTLQLYMGHRNQQLLLTRYVNLRNISRDACWHFWHSLHITPEDISEAGVTLLQGEKLDSRQGHGTMLTT